MTVHTKNEYKENVHVTKHLAHLVFERELLHLVIKQPFADFQHEFIVLRSGELSLSLLWTRRRLHQLKVHGRGRVVSIEGRVWADSDRVNARTKDTGQWRAVSVLDGRVVGAHGDRGGNAVRVVVVVVLVVLAWVSWEGGRWDRGHTLCTKTTPKTTPSHPVLTGREDPFERARGFWQACVIEIDDLPSHSERGTTRRYSNLL